MPSRGTASNRQTAVGRQDAVGRLSASGRLFVEGTPGVDDMNFISETVVGVGGTANVQFAAISGSYRHLLLFFTARSETATEKALRIRFNGDSGANYDTEFLLGFDTTASAVEENGATSGRIGTIPGSDQLAGAPGIGSVWIPYYSSSNYNKTGTNNCGAALTAALIIATIFTFNWRNTAAITQIDIFPASDDIAENGKFSLYGIT